MQNPPTSASPTTSYEADVSSIHPSTPITGTSITSSLHNNYLMKANSMASMQESVSARSVIDLAFDPAIPDVPNVEKDVRKENESVTMSSVPEVVADNINQSINGVGVLSETAGNESHQVETGRVDVPTAAPSVSVARHSKDDEAFLYQGRPHSSTTATHQNGTRSSAGSTRPLPANVTPRSDSLASFSAMESRSLTISQAPVVVQMPIANSTKASSTVPLSSGVIGLSTIPPVTTANALMKDSDLPMLRFRDKPLPPSPPRTPSPVDNATPRDSNLVFGNSSKPIMVVPSLPRGFRRPTTGTTNTIQVNKNMAIETIGVAQRAQNLKGKQFYSEDLADVAWDAKDDKDAQYVTKVEPIKAPTVTTPSLVSVVVKKPDFQPVMTEETPAVEIQVGSPTRQGGIPFAKDNADVYQSPRQQISGPVLPRQQRQCETVVGTSTKAGQDAGSQNGSNNTRGVWEVVNASKLVVAHAEQEKAIQNSGVCNNLYHLVCVGWY